MKAKDIRKLTTPELEARVAELKEELFNLRFQLAVGQLENTTQIKTVKKTIAQMLTVMSERRVQE